MPLASSGQSSRDAVGGLAFGAEYTLKVCQSSIPSAIFWSNWEINDFAEDFATTVATFLHFV